MKTVTPSMIGQIRSAIKYIQTVADGTWEDAAKLGRPDSDEEVLICQIDIAVDNISDAAKIVKKLLKGK